MFRDLIGPHAPAWISSLSTSVTVFSVAVGVLVTWYVYSDRRLAHRERMAALPLDDGSAENTP